MRALIQRVSKASVEVEGKVVGSIEKGLLVLLGVATDDTSSDAEAIADKIATLRCFPDEGGHFEHSVHEVGGGVLVISQFTLLGDCRKGRRPSFSSAARPELATELYEEVIELLHSHALHVEQGVFGAHMDVSLVNDGPVTLMLDSKRTF
jgi:D-tyrosyl-tRNA(Tyr) deacylase